MHLQVTSLRELVEDWDFQEGPFMEFVAPALQLLAGLLHSSEELETQLQVRSCTHDPHTFCVGLCTCISACSFQCQSLQPLLKPWSLANLQEVLSMGVSARISKQCNAYVPDGFWHRLILQVFNLFNLIIERLGEDAKPYGPGILQLLPAVWQQAEGQSLLRIQVNSQGDSVSIAVCCICYCLPSPPSHAHVTGARPVGTYLCRDIARSCGACRVS